MGMAKIRPPQNSNPSTDYDKTLHNWLRPWDKLVNQNWYKSAARERLAKYVKYNASSFLFFIFIFFPDSPTEVTRRPILHNGSNYVESRKDGLLCGPHDGRPDLGVKFPKNLQKEGVVQKSQAKSEKMKILITSKLSNLLKWKFNRLMILSNTQRG